jgi:hypothetical protein
MSRPFLLAGVLFLLFFIFVGMSKTVFRMLYAAPPPDASAVAGVPEKFDIMHFASFFLLAALIALGVGMPGQLFATVVQISHDFGITL